MNGLLNIIVYNYFITFCALIKTFSPRGAVDDLMCCCPRQKTEGDSASGHPQHQGSDSFDRCTERYEIFVSLSNLVQQNACHSNDARLGKQLEMLSQDTVHLNWIKFAQIEKVFNSSKSNDT